MNPYIVLRFRTDHNRDFSYRVSNADKDVEQHDVLAAVSDLLFYKPFDTGRGDITHADSARLVYQEIREFEI